MTENTFSGARFGAGPRPYLMGRILTGRRPDSRGGRSVSEEIQELDFLNFSLPLGVESTPSDSTHSFIWRISTEYRSSGPGSAREMPSREAVEAARGAQKKKPDPR